MRNRKHRLYTAIAAGLAGAILMSSTPEKVSVPPPQKKEAAQAYAWWGCLYPKFCFSGERRGKVKISLWLAQALDWC